MKRAPGTFLSALGSNPPQFSPNKRDIHADVSFIWWGKVDSNHRRHCQQIYSLSHLATLEFPHIQLCWSWWTDSNPRPADYKRWPEHQCIDFRCFLPLSRRGFGSIQAYCVHPVHTVMFPFGSRFGSNGPATRLVDSYWRQITQCRGAQDLRRYKQRIHRHSIIV